MLKANTAKQITLWEMGEPAERRGRAGHTGPGFLRQRVKYLLDVLVLLELVDQGEYFRGLLFG